MGPARNMAAIMVLLFGALTNCRAQEALPRLTVGLAVWPPWKVVDGDTVGGIDVEIVRAVGRRAGFEPRFVVLPWKRCLTTLRDGDTDMLTNLGRNPEREAFTIFVSPPYSRSAVTLYVKRGHTEPLTNYEQLRGKRLGVVLGSIHGEPFDSDRSLLKTEVALEPQLLRMLEAERVDVVIGYRYVLEYHVRTMALDAVVERCPLVLSVRPIFLGLSRRSPHADLAPAVAEAIREMVEAGEVDQIIERVLNELSIRGD
jgi:polar amino acid transport system substrate-binding protein